MKIVNIVTSELKQEVDKAELALESVLQEQSLDSDKKINKIKKAVSRYRHSVEDFKYWEGFVTERIAPKPIEVPKSDKKKENE